jgi:hypothetical protein
MPKKFKRHGVFRAETIAYMEQNKWAIALARAHCPLSLKSGQTAGFYGVTDKSMFGIVVRVFMKPHSLFETRQDA